MLIDLVRRREEHNRDFIELRVVLLPFALINLREGLRSLDGELGEMALSFGRSPVRR